MLINFPDELYCNRWLTDVCTVKVSTQNFLELICHPASYSLQKLPFTIPELVQASPCRSSDGVLYMGKAKPEQSDAVPVHDGNDDIITGGPIRDDAAVGFWGRGLCSISGLFSHGSDLVLVL